MSDRGDERGGKPDEGTPEEWRTVPRFALLDPAGEEPGTVFPTLYVADELLIHPGEAHADALKNLQALAGSAGWSVASDDRDQPAESPRDAEGRAGAGRSRGVSTSVRIRLGVAADQERIAATPDAWAVLRQARRTEWGQRGISLNHVLTTDPFTANPFTANPFTANPFTANPFTANPFTANPFTANAGTVGIASYGAIGSGGRQPVTFVGPAPRRSHPDETPPIVAILDTGCGQHPWLTDAVIEPRLRTGEPIGIEPSSPTDPEREPSLGEPLDGLFDDAAGHGTFIAGIVRQECPDAMILPVRVADGHGVILENDLIGALGRLIAFMDDVVLEKERGGSQVRVLNLSFSFYHEVPGDTSTLSELRVLLDEIRARGCVVVCSAGNEATSRPTYPAAIPADDPGRQVSVGALNPSDRSVALFSNIGEWVEVYAPGVSVVSTVPVVFDGGLQAGTRDDAGGHCRQTLDLDDFRGGFGVWSGTSFAAPVAAGRIAAQLVAGADPDTAKATVVSDLHAEDLSRRE
ncbi:S8/S53 family peptidase [Microbacterium panaciterrae]|uniref:S8 family serine peptidase n=1 Tax=Microbacterium panaciterrae TaxID=985759 RepID=A0ABP8PQZ3_9MICO